MKHHTPTYANRVHTGKYTGTSHKLLEKMKTCISKNRYKSIYRSIFFYSKGLRLVPVGKHE